MTAIAYFKVNGVTVATEQFEGKNPKTVTRTVSHWMCQEEFNIRATLKAARVERATITIGSDNVIIEHEWNAGDPDGKYGVMAEGKVVG